MQVSYSEQLTDGQKKNSQRERCRARGHLYLLEAIPENQACEIKLKPLPFVIPTERPANRRG